MIFQTEYDQILQKITDFYPEEYGRSRNFLDGHVSRLSPYISRGVISTKIVLDRLIERGYDPLAIEKFVQELAWRDYWQQIWKHRGSDIDQDLKHPQTDVHSYGMPKAILRAETGIDAIDQGIRELYCTGYMHNHMRMYVAALACNIAKCHWSEPAKWMYYHLYDADWASNALSWQWVAGANSNKKYLANQENINNYCNNDQPDTYLDMSYEELSMQSIPDELRATTPLNLSSLFPQKKRISLHSETPLLIYNFYNLDPLWRSDIDANRVLLLEPSIFNKHPVSAKTLEFTLQLSQNIPDIQIFCGEFEELHSRYDGADIYFKEHPLNNHYKGHEDARDWMFSVEGYYPSFFAFWKNCKKELQEWLVQK